MSELNKFTNGKYTFEIFPQEYLELDKELKTDYHPQLAFLANYPMDDMDMKLAQIAAYCEVMLDGDYSLENRIELCGILVKKLIEKRQYPQAQTILLPASFGDM